MQVKKSAPSQADEWASFSSGRKTVNFPKWPNEAMLKVLFGSYLERPIDRPSSNWKVLDSGCGFGNNLVPFLELGCECHGVEIHPGMVSDTSRILQDRGYQAKIHLGSNRALPFDDGYFDAVLSINALHYEGSQENVEFAIAEFKRVLRPGGVIYLSTVGPSHDLRVRSEPLGQGMYRIRDWDFRSGQVFYFFENPEEVRELFSSSFKDIEVGLVTEDLMKLQLQFIIAVLKNE